MHFIAFGEDQPPEMGASPGTEMAIGPQKEADGKRLLSLKML